MKATRRQELKTNELARMLEDAREFLRVRGNYLVGGLVVVAIAALGYVYMNRSAAQALADANRQVDTLPFGTDAEVKDSIEKLKALAAEHDDNEAFVMNTLRRRAAFAMRRAHVAEDGTLSKEFLDVAAEAYHAIVDRFGHRSLDVAAAHCGLATIEEDLFILDNDPAHKEAARRYLEGVRDNEKLNGTPFQTIALERLNKLDGIFVQVTMVDAPHTPLPPAVLELPDGGKIPLDKAPPEVRERLEKAASEGSVTIAEPTTAQPTAAEVPAATEKPQDSEEPPAGADQPDAGTYPSTQPSAGTAADPE